MFHRVPSCPNRTIGFTTALAFALAASMACKAKEPEAKPEPTLVKTAVVEEGAITEWIELQGRVAPPFDRDATVSPLVAGRIVELSVRAGQAVSAGEVLARVETATLDDELRSAEASVRRSQADAAFKRSVAIRTRELATKGVASRQEADSDEAAAVAADSARSEGASALALAKRRREWSDLRAPFDGVVVRVDRRVGDFVDGTAATPVAEVAALDGWEIVASATPSTLGRLRLGQHALVLGLALQNSDSKDEGIGATITTIARAVDPATGTGDVRLGPRSRALRVALGAAVRIRVSTMTHANAVLVPAAALRAAPDGSVEVVVVKDGKAHVTRVEVGLTEEGRVEILSGLSSGAKVVVEDPLGIAEGASVREAS